MLIMLSWNGHAPNKLVEVTDAEYARIQELTKRAYLFDTEEGQDLIADLDRRPAAMKPPVVLVYA